MAEEKEKTDETETKKQDESAAGSTPETATATDSSKTSAPEGVTATVSAAASPPSPASPAAAVPPPSPASPGHNKDKQRSLVVIFAETLQHINGCEKDKSIVFRHNDRKSVILMLSAFALEVVTMWLFLLTPSARTACIVMALLADLLFGLSILWYVLLRFGVLRSFERRQTLLTWQLMIGAGALFAFYTMNIAFAFFTYYTFAISAAPPPPL